MSGYQTKQERVPVAGVDDLIIRSLLDRQQFFDPRGDADRLGISSASWPLFGLLWPSGAQLAARMALRPVSPAERVLEIGCGLALASLVGHRRGANVTASDCHPLAESFLAQNLRLNELPPMKYQHGHWEETRSGCQFDLIIGSDVLYERDTKGTLAGFIERHCSPAGSVWIVDPDRGNRPAFNR
ncbi:MAG: SAM-dependent methyltransferase, partial [Gammaproteobacteria bacterium]